MMKLSSFSSVLCAAFILAACGETPSQPEADIVLTGGYIYTVDDERSIHQALAIKDGRILAVGADSDIEKFIGPKTDRRKLDGKMVMPGLHDTHIHALGTIAPDACDLDNDVVTLDALVAIIQGCIEKYDVPEGEWVPVLQWNPYEGNQPSATNPTLRAALDAASTKHPIFLFGNDGHHGGANSMALNSVSPALNAQSLKTDYRALADLVAVDGSGNPTGGLNEGAMTLVGTAAEEGLVQPAEVVMPKVAAFLASRGITSIQDASVQWAALKQYKWLSDSGRMTFRLRTALNYPLQNGHSPEDLANVPTMIEELKKMRTFVGDSPYLRADATKLFADGVMEGNQYGHPPTLPVAASIAPYHQPIFTIDTATGSADVSGYVDPESAACQQVRQNPDAYTERAQQTIFESAHGFLPKQCFIWSGILEHSEDLIKAYITQATDAGFHVHVHAISDKAVRVTADAFETAKASADKQGLTQSLAHVQLAEPGDLARLGKLGAYISYTYHWIKPSFDYEMSVIPFVDKINGKDDLYNPDGRYMQHAYAVKTAMNQGIIPVYGSDAPVESRDPRVFPNMQQALTRESDGVVLNAAERINIHDAIASFTISSARMMAQAQELGSLEVGKLADMVILDQNIMKLANDGKANQIGETKVLTTIFDGKVVFEAP